MEKTTPSKIERFIFLRVKPKVFAGRFDNFIAPKTTSVKDRINGTEIAVELVEYLRASWRGII